MTSLSRPGRRASNAFTMIVILLPMAALIGAALFATARRTVIEQLGSAQAEYMTREAACAQAERAGFRLTGFPQKAVNATRSLGYSHWRQNPMPVWEVNCVGRTGAYRLNVNGLTGQVYSLKRTSASKNLTPAADTTTSSFVTWQGDMDIPEQATTQELSDAPLAPVYLANRSLKALGILSQRVTLLHRARSWTQQGMPLSVFIFSQNVASFGRRTINVAINDRTGELELIWNAAGGL